MRGVRGGSLLSRLGVSWITVGALLGPASALVMLSGGALGLILLLSTPSRWALGLLLGPLFRAIVALSAVILAPF